MGQETGVLMDKYRDLELPSTEVEVSMPASTGSTTSLEAILSILDCARNFKTALDALEHIG